MRLVKNNDVFVTDNENVIDAYKEAGYIEEAEPVKAEAPKKAPVKKTKA